VVILFVWLALLPPAPAPLPLLLFMKYRINPFNSLGSNTASPSSLFFPVEMDSDLLLLPTLATVAIVLLLLPLLLVAALLLITVLELLLMVLEGLTTPVLLLLLSGDDLRGSIFISIE